MRVCVALSFLLTKKFNKPLHLNLGTPIWINFIYKAPFIQKVQLQKTGLQSIAVTLKKAAENLWRPQQLGETFTSRFVAKFCAKQPTRRGRGRRQAKSVQRVLLAFVVEEESFPRWWLIASYSPSQKEWNWMYQNATQKWSWFLCKPGDGIRFPPRAPFLEELSHNAKFSFHSTLTKVIIYTYYKLVFC